MKLSKICVFCAIFFFSASAEEIKCSRADGSTFMIECPEFTKQISEFDVCDWIDELGCTRENFQQNDVVRNHPTQRFNVRNKLPAPNSASRADAKRENMNSQHFSPSYSKPNFSAETAGEQNHGARRNSIPDSAEIRFGRNTDGIGRNFDALERRVDSEHSHKQDLRQQRQERTNLNEERQSRVERRSKTPENLDRFHKSEDIERLQRKPNLVRIKLHLEENRDRFQYRNTEDSFAPTNRISEGRRPQNSHNSDEVENFHTSNRRAEREKQAHSEEFHGEFLNSEQPNIKTGPRFERFSRNSQNLHDVNNSERKPQNNVRKDEENNLRLEHLRGQDPNQLPRRGSNNRRPEQIERDANHSPRHSPRFNVERERSSWSYYKPSRGTENVHNQRSEDHEDFRNNGRFSSSGPHVSEMDQNQERFSRVRRRYVEDSTSSGSGSSKYGNDGMSPDAHSRLSSERQDTMQDAGFYENDETRKRSE